MLFPSLSLNFLAKHLPEGLSVLTSILTVLCLELCHSARKQESGRLQQPRHIQEYLEILLLAIEACLNHEELHRSPCLQAQQDVSFWHSTRNEGQSACVRTHRKT